MMVLRGRVWKIQVNCLSFTEKMPTAQHSTPKNSNKLFPYLHAWFTLYFTLLEHLFFSLGTPFLFISFLHKLSFVFAKPEAFSIVAAKMAFCLRHRTIKNWREIDKMKVAKFQSITLCLENGRHNHTNMPLQAGFTSTYSWVYILNFSSAGWWWNNKDLLVERILGAFCTGKALKLAFLMIIIRISENSW